MMRILGGGLCVGLLWTLWAQFVWHDGYPESFILGNPSGRYCDFTDNTLAAQQPNPYVDPFSVYSPTFFLLFRALSWSDDSSLILVYFFSLTSLALLLARLLRPVTPGPWKEVSLAFLFLGISYPVLFCLDRGNIEIMMAPFIGWGLYFYSRRRDVAGTVCLFPAICLKFYPGLLLVLLLRRRKAGLAVLCGLGVIGINLASSCLFPASPAQLWTAYRENLTFWRDFYYLENSALEGSASLWNAGKIVLIALQDMQFIRPITFSFDGPFILAACQVYSTLLAVFALACAGYAWLYERRQVRSMLILLLFLSIAAPNGADYRLLYASMALALLALLPQRRRGDWLALILIALAVVPKKEILLTFVGKTETQYADVPIQAVFNPIFIFTAMAILLYEARHPIDWRQTALRLRDLLPWRWKWI
jgi:hypothetical protein